MLMQGWSPALAADYWEGRAQQFASKGRGLAAVCSYGMPGFYNAYIESTQRRALLPWLDDCLRLPGRRALDGGCGVGRLEHKARRCAATTSPEWMSAPA